MTSLDGVSPDVQPLLTALHDLSLAYDEAQQRAEALLDALVTNNFAAVQEAVAGQRAALHTIEQIEQRRRNAEAALARLLTMRGLLPAESVDKVNSSVLLTILPPDDAECLRKVRQDLLTRLVGLQSTYRQATMLLHTAQAVVKRAVRNSARATIGYTARGEHTSLSHDLRRRSARLA
jgi:hypothetical protein